MEHQQFTNALYELINDAFELTVVNRVQYFNLYLDQ